ncbi:MAG: hypothetical protein IKR90_00455 [Clostridia bacterium]|nr:hypothetical protein [Clostridia bacterium]
MLLNELPATYVVKKTGEKVTVYQGKDNSGEITVVYRGKEYTRPLSALGDTLIPYTGEETPALKPKVKPGTVFILQDLNDGFTQKVRLTETAVKAEYRRMGGSYYGAGVNVSYDADDSFDDDGDDCVAVSADSPLGRLVINHGVNYTFSFKTQSGETANYIILSIIK